MKRSQNTENELQIEYRPGIMQVILFIFILTFIPGVMFTDNKLVCERIEPSAPVNCEMWKVFSGIVANFQTA